MISMLEPAAAARLKGAIIGPFVLGGEVKNNGIGLWSCSVNE
jgi:hypothetical protein